MNEIIIEATAIKKTLGRGAGEVKALRGIDLTLRRGEFTLLMGPSGSGKTTLLLVLGCMLAPSSGALTVCGTPTSGVDKEGLARIRRDHIGFVFSPIICFRRSPLHRTCNSPSTSVMNVEARPGNGRRKH